MEFRTSPGKMGSVQRISVFLAGASPLFPAWVSKPVALVAAVAASSSLGGLQPPRWDAWREERPSLRPLLPCSFLDCPAWLVEPQSGGPLPISAPVFEAFGQLVSCHSGWLDRFAFGCGNSAVLACARAGCPKSHSQSCLRVLSYLSSYLLAIFHTAVPTWASPLALPGALASSAIFPQGTSVGTSLPDRPPARVFLWFPRSNSCFPLL